MMNGEMKVTTNSSERLSEPFIESPEEKIKRSQRESDSYYLLLNMVKENVRSLEGSSKYITLSYNALFLMYCLLFIVGLITAIAAIIKGFSAQNGTEAIPSLIFAGLSSASFFTLFISRPLESLERNIIFSLWLTIILNSSRTRLGSIDLTPHRGIEPKNLTSDIMGDLSMLADKYAAILGKHPAVMGGGTSTAPIRQNAGALSTSDGKELNVATADSKIDEKQKEL